MTNTVRTIFKNMSWMLIAQIITSILSFGWTILIARYLGPSEYGIYGTAVSFSSLLLFIADLGVSSYITRAISTDFDNEYKYLNNAFSLTIILSFLYLLVVLMTLLLIRWDSYTVLICLLFAIENIFIRFSVILNVIFQAHEQMKYQAIANIITSVSTFALTIIVIFKSFGLIGVSLTFIFANIISFIYVLLTVKKHFVKIKFIINPSFYEFLIKGGIPFAISGVFVTIYYSIDLVMITQFVGTYETGIYNSAYKLLTVLTLFYSIYTSVVYPVMSKLFKDSKDLLQLSFIKSSKYLVLISIPICVFTCFYRYDIIGIYGAEFTEAGSVLAILIWTICFIFINGNSTAVLNASHKEYSVTIICGLAALLNVILNVIFIPIYSVYGASFATVLSEVLVFLLEFYVLKKIGHLPDKHFILDIIKICISSGVLAIVLYYLDLNMWLAMPVSILVYFAIIILLKTPDEEDKLIMKQIFNRN